MKFLCIDCDRVMEFAERQLPGDGTLAAVYTCPGCGREMALLTNPMETRLVSSLGVQIGGREVPEQPMEVVRSSLEGGREDAFEAPDEDEETSSAPGEGDEVAGGATGAGGAAAGSGSPGASPQRPPGGRVSWSPAATDRLSRVPSFVRGMVKRIYTDYARERGIATISPAVMDRARTDLGLEGM